jgi:hypothetical protein
MSNKNYTTSFTVDQSPQDVFAAINNVRRWWSQATEGDTDKLGAVFYYHYQDVHRCTFKISELVPGKKVVWHVLHNDFNFIRDKTEWNGTDVVFEIARKGNQTEVRFTHVGLVSAYECYDVCADAWGTYITRSLRDLIATGKGQPNPIVGEPPVHQKEIVTKVREMSRALQSEQG